MGTLITFYSYKGGVGRTMALANIAALLATWGRKVLVIDWDLEAPGIEHFLAQGHAIESIQKRRGLIDLLIELSEVAPESVDASAWMPLVIKTRVPQTGVSVSLLTAGARTQGYFNKVRKLDVRSFYEDRNGGHIIEALRASWRMEFDFVLVDSRTGITDIGGVCTVQLPDVLAIVFTATEQSLSGAVDVAIKAAVERQKLPFDRSLVPTVPIPSRFDTQTEREIAQCWLTRFEQALSPLLDKWLPKEVNRRAFLELTKIPYTPYFSFGEGLPVIEQGTTDPAGLGYAYETVTALIGNNLQNSELLLSNRDEFVRLACSPNRLPKTPLRNLALPCVLFIDLVGAGAFRGTIEREGTSSSEQEEILGKYQSLVATCARSEEGQLAMSDGDSFLFAFPGVENAIRCSLSIERALAVRTPINTPLGHLRVRMAIHATGGAGEPSKRMQALLQTATRIASKAKEGEILTSGAVRSLSPKAMKNVRFEQRKEQLELIGLKGVQSEESLHEVVETLPAILNPEERSALFKQNPKSKSGGGFQAFLVGLQERVDTKTGRLELTTYDRERIARYAHDYRGGGWQLRLKKIFARTLGANLGRESA
jgi:class 3 adenylate cyclase/cellulose biosynthesis protein BcsQ